jgi:hypothetical protein
LFVEVSLSNTECAIQTSSGNLKKFIYDLQYPQALLFYSKRTHKAPEIRNTGVALHSLQNKTLYNLLKSGELHVKNIYPVTNLLS